MKTFIYSIFVAIIFSLFGTCYAEDFSESEGTYYFDKTGPFVKGRLSVQSVAGVLYSPVLINTHYQDIDYYQMNLRIGMMLSDPAKPKHFFRGNTEGVIEISYSDVFEGGGNTMTGAAGLLRYNIVYPKTRIFPFLQVGAGLIYNDIHKDKTQSVIGQAIEFTLRGSIGARFLMAKKWSMDIEGTFEHVSNAGMSNRNGGLNAAGGFVGLTHYF